jgi:biotin-(acetyl-CoA carboxylase) ligase
MVEVLDRGDREAVCHAWRRLGQSGLAGTPVRWRDAGQEIERRGRARGIDVDGALLVECDGHVERLIAGDVQWETWARD